MSGLSALYLYGNSLIGNVFSVIFISICLGVIPTTIGQLTKLSILELHSNEFNGTIPSSIGQMSSLTALYLYGNSLTGRYFVIIFK